MEGELQEERAGSTARDRPWKPPDNSTRHTTEQSSAEAPFKGTKSRELSASAGTYKPNQAVEVSLQPQGA